MANVARKWLPPFLIAAACAASAAVYGRVPALVDLRADALLPFAVTPPPDRAPRWLVLTFMPALGLVLWVAFRLAPTPAGHRLARRMFKHAPDEVTDPAQFGRFGKTYDAIVLGLMMLLLGLHAAVLAAVLGAPALASRLVPAALGAALVGIGNVMPRVRPNWVAGLRTQRLFDNPQLWREAHRVFGAAFVVAGVVTIISAVVAPRYGLLVGLSMVLLSCVIGFAASTRDGHTRPNAGLVFVALLCAAASQASAQPPAGMSKPITLDAPASVAESSFVFARGKLALHGTLAWGKARRRPRVAGRQS